MKVRVLVVDDSGFFRRRVTEILGGDAHLEVVGTASNGVEAIEKTVQLKPDVITMDIEMPVMDGITAVRRIMASNPTPVLMFSSLTTDGAQATLDALDAGAVDFLPKRFEDLSQDREEAKRLLCSRVRTVGTKGMALRQGALKKAPVLSEAPKTARVKEENFSSREAIGASVKKYPGNCKLVAIGTSTGGPVALQQVLSKLPANFPFPLLLVQHMPASFTPAFAQRLDKLCAIKVKEAEDGDFLEAGVALLAPGGRQMLLEQRSGKVYVRIHDGEQGQIYKPSVDITFSSAAKIFPGQVLSVVMTGMGADGREGARLLKQGGSVVWVQDEQSCVVYGMPMAIVEAGLADQVMSLQDIGNNLAHRN
ncbi:MAG: chemotaxis response regulator protein-glutamate methylesterase [Gammaproteobacteria bacterium]